MPVAVTCSACQAHVTIPDRTPEDTSPERTGKVRCDRCGAEIELDADGASKRPEGEQESPSSPKPAVGAHAKEESLPSDSGEPQVKSQDGAFEPVQTPLSEPADRKPSSRRADSAPELEVALLDDGWEPEPERPAALDAQVDTPPREPKAPARERPRSVPPAALHRIGRYTVFEEFASGGMASVHFGRLYGAAGFSRVVAIKRLHLHLLKDPSFADMFVTEARLAARVRHPNVVEILDVIADEQEIALVMEYVAGESLVALVRSAAQRGETLPLDVATGIMVGILQGLHAAHEARDERGQPLFIVHRDVSPHNVLVGADGVARVFDFGIAKAVEAAENTDPGLLKGKASYMAPEQIQGAPLSRAADIFAAGVVFWELLTGRKLFGGRDNAERLYKVLEGGYPRPSEYQPEIPAALDDAVMRAMAPHPEDRFATALEYAEAVEHATFLASPRTIGNWVSMMASETLALQDELMTAVEGLPPESATPIAARIAEEGLSTFPPPAAVPRFTPSPPPPRRTGLLLALGGVVVGAVLVMLVLKFVVTSAAVPSTTAVSPSASVERPDPPGETGAPSRLGAPVPSDVRDAAPGPSPAPSASTRAGARTPRLRNPREFRPSEL
jgi:serine/threonine-protein kinase